MNAIHVLSLISAIAIAGLSGTSYADDDRYTHHREPSHEKVRTAFYELEQHGTWHQLERYGMGWCPTVAKRTRNWNPYHSDGAWIFPEGNREWRSYHGWGYIVFNTEEGTWRKIYGVWHWIPERGWRGFKHPIHRVLPRPIPYNSYRWNLHQGYPRAVHSQGNRIYYRDPTYYKYRDPTYYKKHKAKHMLPAHQPRHQTPIAPRKSFGKWPPSKAKPHRSVHQPRYHTPIEPRKSFGKRPPSRAKPHHAGQPTPPRKDHDQKNRSRDQKHGGDRKPW
jgi:hypothetical protein